MVKKLMASALLSIGLVGLMSGCAVKTGNTQLEKYQKKDISQLLIKGKTTEEQVRKYFGDPASADFMPDGRKKWKYVYLEKREKAINYVPVANWFVRGTNDEARTLVVVFKNGVVDDYIFTASKGETKAGTI